MTSETTNKDTRTVKLWAQSITDLYVTLEVPANATDNQIVSYVRNNMDGGDFVAAEGLTDGEWVWPTEVTDTDEEPHSTLTASDFGG